LAIDKVFGDYVLICDACGLPIVGDDYDNRHWGHEDGCPNKKKPDSVDCCCDLEYHADCCPDCKDITDDDDDDDDWDDKPPHMCFQCEEDITGEVYEDENRIYYCAACW